MRSIFTFLLLSVFGFTAHAQTADEYPSDVLNDYFAHQLTLIKETPGFTPPVASRALGYTGLTAYESVVHGISGMNSLAGMVPQFDVLPLPEAGEELHWPTVANHCQFLVASEMFSNMSSENLEILEGIRDSYDDTFSATVDGDIMLNSQGYATTLATAIIDYANEDGEEGCQFSNFPEFDIPVGDGLWTPLDGQQALQPYWGDKRCFVVEYVDLDLIAMAPPAFSTEESSTLYQEAMAVYEAVNNATTEEQNIAEFWADGGGTITPPGHSFSMLLQVIELEESNLAFAAEAFARLGMGVSDAFVQCWKTKYVYNLERPITYIQSYIDPDWNTIVATPPFPEYTSGHSSQSGAFGEIMTALFGDNYAFTDNTHGSDFGGPRSFSSFMEAAEEAAISRLYGGIHYPVGNNMGLQSGLMIGDMVNEMFEIAASVDDSYAAAELKVYPNPGNGMLSIAGNDFAGKQILVYDMAGKQVKTLSAAQRIDLTDLESGMYVLSMLDTQNGAMAGNTRILIQ